MSNTVTTALYVGFAFFGGFIVGIGIELVLALIFWFCIGYLAVLAIDAAAGLWEPVCEARDWARTTMGRWFAGHDLPAEQPIVIRI